MTEFKVKRQDGLTHVGLRFNWWTLFVPMFAVIGAVALYYLPSILDMVKW